VSRTSVEAFSSLNIPQLNGLVATATGEDFPITTNSDREYAFTMSGASFQAPTCINIPQLDRLVATAAKDDLTVGTKRN
jgi:hypothetical protein